MTLAALEGPALGARILTGIESGAAVGPRDPRVLSSEPGRFMIADTDTWDYLDSDPKAKLDSTSSYPDYILDISDDVEALLDVQRNAAPCPDDEIAF